MSSKCDVEKFGVREKDLGPPIILLFHLLTHQLHSRLKAPCPSSTALTPFLISSVSTRYKDSARLYTALFPFPPQQDLQEHDNLERESERERRTGQPCAS
jgi:hypothetical protein